MASVLKLVMLCALVVWSNGHDKHMNNYLRNALQADDSLRSLNKILRTSVTKRARVLYGILSDSQPPSLLQAEGPVLYGIYSSNVSSYQPMLAAQFETWAKHVPRQDIVISGSPRDDAIENVSSVPLKCQDSAEFQPCKEGTLLYRAHARARERQADWFVSATEDKFIWTDEVEKALATYDPTKPVVFARMGCGFGRRSSEFIGCEDVYKKGGICGGTTYIMSRAALDSIAKEGQSYDDFMKEYLSHVGGAHASDIVTSCLLYDRKIPMRSEPYITGRTRQLDAVPGETENEIGANARRQIGSDPLLVHMVMLHEQVPRVMRALYKENVSDVPGVSL